MADTCTAACVSSETFNKAVLHVWTVFANKYKKQAL